MRPRKIASSIALVSCSSNVTIPTAAADMSTSMLFSSDILEDSISADEWWMKAWLMADGRWRMAADGGRDEIFDVEGVNSRSG